jgi:hypothetical protein
MRVTFPAAANDRGDTPLDVVLSPLAGAVPIGLRGSVFGVAPTGPATPNTPFLNGPPLFYRLDFDGGVARLRTRRGGGPSARVAAGAEAEGEEWRFRDFGITRLSPKLGARDFSNTALLPVRAPGGAAGLLATYDAGRPHHLDPDALELLAPLGAQRSWRANLLMARPFKQVFSTAHPAYDAAADELFVVNHGRSLNAVLSRLFGFVRRWIPWASAPDDDFDSLLARGVGMMRGAMTDVASAPAALPRLLSSLRHAVVEVVDAPVDTLLGTVGEQLAFAEWLLHFGKMLAEFAKDGPLEGEGPRAPFTYLLRWRGAAGPRRYALHLNGAPLQVLESAHQMAVTRDWVVIVDAAFKMELDGITSIPNAVPESLVAAFRREVSRPQSHTARFYFVRRADLDRADLPSDGHPSFPASVVDVTEVVVPGEVVHFHADFLPSPEGHAVLYAVHQNAMDGAEFVLRGDRRYDGAALPPEVLGTFPASMSTNAVGRHAVDVARACVAESRVVQSPDLTWALGLTAGPGINTGLGNADRHTALYVYSQGLVPDQLTELVHALYDTYPHRAESDLRRLLADGGAPAALLRVDLATMSIVAHHRLAADQQLVSPQFVPDAGGGPGWLVCNVFSGDDSIANGFAPREVWIYAADALAAGPACRLGHESLDWGYTLHTAWLPEVTAATRAGLVTLEDDLGDWLREPEIWDFYDRHLR